MKMWTEEKKMKKKKNKRRDCELKHAKLNWYYVQRMERHCHNGHNLIIYLQRIIMLRYPRKKSQTHTLDMANEGSHTRRR